MQRRRFCFSLIFAAATFIVAPSSSVGVDFVKDVEPILVERCLDCHGPDKQKGKFRVDQRAVLLAGGDSGEPAIKPGDTDQGGASEYEIDWRNQGMVAAGPPTSASCGSDKPSFSLRCLALLGRAAG